MEQQPKVRVWSLSALLGGIVSVACMGSMGAMSAAATGGMAGMGSTVAASSGHVVFMTQMLQAIGLVGQLTRK